MNPYLPRSVLMERRRSRARIKVAAALALRSEGMMRSEIVELSGMSTSRVERALSELIGRGVVGYDTHRGVVCYRLVVGYCQFHLAEMGH